MLTTLVPTFAVLLVLQVVMLPFRRRGADRRLGGPGQYRLFRQARRSGEVPEGARVELWRASLDRSLSQQGRRRIRAIWGMAGGLLVLAVFLQTVTVLIDGGGAGAVMRSVVPFVVVMSVLAGLAKLREARALRRLRSLRTALDA